MINLFRRTILILLIISMLSTIYGQMSEWERVTSPVNTTLTNLSFVNKQTGWASGELGTIIKTSDGGRSWQAQNSTVPYFITGLSFVDENHGWAVTVSETFPFNTIILKTTDGGEGWIATDFQDSSAFMRTIFFLDSLHGFIGGSYIAETSDGGETWIKASVDSSILSGFPVYKFKFYNKQFGYACGGAIDIAGVIWRTTDFGKNWSATGVSADQVFDLFVFDSLRAVALSGDPEGFYGIAKIETTDGGLSWELEELPFFGLSFAIDFRNTGEGWSASGFKFLTSSDTGRTWYEKNVPDSAVIYNLQFVDSTNGFAVGTNGIILKYKPKPVTVLNHREYLYQFALHQNFPNPFNPSTKIKYTVPSVGTSFMKFVQLTVYDVLGNEIATLVNEEKPAGEYEVEFNSNSRENPNLTSGVYFYRLQAGNFIETKKMVYLK